MQKIRFLQKTSQQLQSKINAGVKIILANFLKTSKTKKRKRQLLRREKEKLVKVILSIARITVVLIQLIVPSLLQNNHSVIIHFSFQAIWLIIKSIKTKKAPSFEEAFVPGAEVHTPCYYTIQ